MILADTNIIIDFWNKPAVAAEKYFQKMILQFAVSSKRSFYAGVNRLMILHKYKCPLQIFII